MPPAVEVVVLPPPPEEAANKTPEAGKDGAPSKPTIGIIYPPPELRNIVDKTASFVARNGPEFEARIRQNEINNPKFNFLNPGDPYNAYYHHKVKEFKEGKAVLEPAPLPPTKPAPPVPKITELSRLTEQQLVLKDPPLPYEFVADPPSISALDLDIVKLTAQFVARNGRQFLTNLMNREQRNYQFDFLRPQHSLFTYFTKLLEQYTKILIPPKDLMNKLKNESETPKAVLEQVRYRVEWTRMQEAQKRREEEEAERERVQYAQIDWHDFVVVETVDYQPNEQGLFPPPTNPDEVGTRVLQQQRMEEAGEEVEMEVESDDEGSDVETSKGDDGRGDAGGDDDRGNRGPSPPPQPPKEAPPQPPPLPPQPDKVVVRKDYNPKVAKVQPQPVGEQQYLISPITGEKIPADKMQEHMRIGLLDPRWVEQRDRALQEKLQQEEVYAQGSAIEDSLRQFAERRTDIFGLGDEETAIGKKIGEEEKKRPEKVTWDGHTASMEAATRAARANITIEEQIQQIHKIKGLLPDEEKERIGPSKPQNPPLPPNPPPPPPPATTSTIGTSTAAGSTPVTVTTSSAPPSASKPQPPPPLPPSSVVTTASIPISTPQQRPPPPPPPMSMPPHPPGIPGLMHQPLLPPPQGLMMAPLGPPSHLQPPPLLAMSQRPPMAPGIGPAPPFGQPMNPMPPPPPQPPIEQPAPPPPVSVPGKTSASGPTEDEPPAKRQRTEESLIPEEEFLKNNKSPATFRVQVPNLSEKAEWKLNGQMIALTLPLTDTVSVIKAKIHEETGMPPGKQKLQYEGLFFKDSNTLAYYNVVSGSVISLQLKERGGRKK